MLNPSHCPSDGTRMPAGDPAALERGAASAAHRAAPPLLAGMAGLLVAVLLNPMLGSGGGLGRFLRGIWRQLTRPGSPSEAALYRDLVARSQGDTARAERLIEAEARRNPQASRRQLLEAALYRLSR